ncbi:hypothetical protein MN608_02007 [Microdochium nivale]|nr:hypothetical protein MN608_02007 [Microdochium nivale]
MKASLANALCLALATAGSSALAQSQSPQCVKDCGTQFPISSWCDGGETGIALSNCTCQTLQNSALLKCIRTKCAPDALLAYAQALPMPCASSLFPTLGLSTNTAASTPTTSGSGITAGSNPTSTAPGGGGASTTPANTPPPGAANGLVAPGFVLAAGPLLAAALF